MKHKRLILITLFLAFLWIISISKVEANSIKKIDMDVSIDSSGNASVTEIWDCNLTAGTEGFRAFSNLGNVSITNFSVSDDTGRTYESLSKWDESSSFNTKAYHSGINYKYSGLELCWGISKYGNRTYTLKYNINNLVTQYTDTQGIYFNFINIDQAVNNAKITIHSNTDFSLDNSRIWAFGYKGSINFDNGKIVLDSNGKLSESQYMVGMVRFESNLFNTNNTSNKSFDDVYDSAMSTNSSTKNKTQLDFFTSFFSIIGFIAECVLTVVIYPLLIIFIVKKLRNRHIFNDLDFGANGTTLPKDSEIDYWREIPCNGDIIRAYWICYNYNIISPDKLKPGIIGAILLEWIKQGLVTVSKTKKGLFSIKDNNYAIDFSKMTHGENDFEDGLYKILYSASGINRILEAKEFEKWCKKNYYRINSWFSSLINGENNLLEKEGLITTITEEKTGFLGFKQIITTKKVNESLRDEAIKLKGLKKFLLDFSTIPDREFIEVHLLENYLIFAQLFGIADKVEEQFSKLYPNFNQESLLNTQIATIAIRSISLNGYNEAVRAKRLADARASRYSGSSSSSGGGGSSFSSGGHSSGGSSGGGFR